MKVYHISAECYPVAKVGGLGDVVGALPKYQNSLNIDASVIMPWYDKPFMSEQSFEQVFAGDIRQGSRVFEYQILQEKHVFWGLIFIWSRFLHC